MVFRSRGLKRPNVAPELKERVPPGQYLTARWPVLHHGAIPSFDQATWDFHASGLVERELRFTWEEFLGLPRVSVTADMHCVTRWSKLANTWEGVSARTVMDLAGVKPEAKYVIFHCEAGYTANLPIDVIAGEDVLFALRHDGADLTPEHGYPLRAVVPTRYAWKSAKWIRGVEFVAHDRLGFWEQYGYHSNADFWKEERFSE